MKKYMGLLALVLGMSSTAWGLCGVQVEITTAPLVCGEPVEAEALICCPGQCELDGEPVRSQFGSLIYYDVCVRCTCLDGCSSIPLDLGTVLEEPSVGLHAVIVRVWCRYEGCACWPYSMFCRPLFCGIGSAYFRVCCPNGCCLPCLCLGNSSNGLL